MSTRNLDLIFKPQRIAIMGITPNPKSVGGIVLSNIVRSGYSGVVYPVNPQYEAVSGIPCFRDLASLPKSPELAVICAPAPEVPGMVAECGRHGIRGLIILSAGSYASVARIIPPLVTTAAEVDLALGILEESVVVATAAG